MNRTKKSVLSIVLVFVFMFMMSAIAFAETNVTYDGDAQHFVFAPENLFENFDDVMPGDVISQEIKINNKASNKVDVKVYLKCEPIDSEYADFLSNLHLTVTQVGKSKHFDAPADQTDGLTDFAYLGTITSGGKETLMVTLEVPIDLPNEFQDSFGKVSWTFKVEELENEAPITGENNLIYILCGVCVLAAALLVVFIILRKKDKENDKKTD